MMSLSSLSSSSSSVRYFSRRIGTRATTTNITSNKSNTTTSNENSSITAHKRIALMLYRNLIRWCDDMVDIPLADLVPPIHIQPPQIDSDSIRALHLSSMIQSGESDNPKAQAKSASAPSSIRSFFPPKALIKETGITVSVRTSTDAKHIIRGVFRMNTNAESKSITSNTNEKQRKEQISLAMDWIKSMNILTEKMLEMKLQRKIHQDRDGVHYKIGQVVKHKKFGWRAVIIGWKKNNTKTNTNKKNNDTNESSSAPPETTTSLTQKSYQSINPDDAVVYDVALDLGDATLRSSHPSGIKNVYQSDLSILDDPYLMRIRTSNDHQFKRFDSDYNCFVPGDSLLYVYPNDIIDDDRYWSSSSSYECKYNNKSDQAAQNVILGVQKVSNYLRRIILGYVSESTVANKKLTLLSNHLEKLTKLDNCDVVPPKEYWSKNGLQTQTILKWQLQKFVELVIEVEDILWTRRRAIETDRPIKFDLGQYVQHKKYGFRGIVVAWDSEPAYEVTHWDGLQHIENPEQYPFYHVIPDRKDTISAFGEERSWRYVCSENLEPCPIEIIKELDIDLEPEWKLNTKTGVYTPPDETIFRYGNKLDDDGITEKCLQEIKTAINSILTLIREGTSKCDNADMNAIVDLISRDNLFQILKFSEDADTATVITDSFKEIWKAHNDKDIRYKFDTGVNYLLNGKTDIALNIFGEVVDDDPFFAEAWNKASTCEFMFGNLDASLAAANKTLEIIPTHFQAMNGLGLVYSEKRDLNHARDIFRKSIDLDPWAPVATRLSVCIDTIEKWKKTSVMKNNEGVVKRNQVKE